MVQTVVGVDGCPAGWIAVVWEQGRVESKLFQEFAEIVRPAAFSEFLVEEPAMIAVDMPIGFPDNYGRNADIEARKALSPFGSRVFPVPCREAVHAASYTEAIRINKSHSDGISIPPVTNAIRPRMQKIDGVMLSGDMEPRVREIHPEVSFYAMNGKAVLKHKKKTPEGEKERLSLLRAAGFPELDWQAHHFRKSQVKRDDIIDACAAAWSARRILEGNALHYPMAEERDSRGLLMRIHA